MARRGRPPYPDVLTPREWEVLVAAVATFAVFGFLVACSSSSESAGRVHELAYIDAGGALMLYDADTEEKRKLAEAGACGEYPQEISWSPDGATLACWSGTTQGILLIDPMGVTAPVRVPIRLASSLDWSADASHFVERSSMTLATRSGEIVAEFDNPDLSSESLWSPDGGTFAYYSPDLEQSVLYSIADGSEVTLEGKRSPLGWALDGKAMILADNIRPAFERADYDAVLVDAGTEQVVRRLPDLDDGKRFWISPSGSFAAFGSPAESPEESARLAVLDLRTGATVTVPGSSFEEPGLGVDAGVAFSGDEQFVYWADDLVGGTVFRARLDGSDLTELTSAAQSQEFAISSGDPMIAFGQRLEHAEGDEETVLTVALGDGSKKREVARKPGLTEGSFTFFAFAWRPAVVTE